MRVNNGRTLISTHRMTPEILGRNAVEKVQFRENHFFIALFSLFLDHCKYFDFTNRILIIFYYLQILDATQLNANFLKILDMEW